MLSSCSNRQLPFSGPVYRVMIAETSCAAVDLAFSGVPKCLCRHRHIPVELPQAAMLFGDAKACSMSYSPSCVAWALVRPPRGLGRQVEDLVLESRQVVRWIRGA